MQHIPPGLVALRIVIITAIYVAAAVLFGWKVFIAMPAAIIIAMYFGMVRSLLIVPAICSLILMYYLLSAFGLQPFMPSLVRNWPKQSEFDRRIKEKFPIGTPESSLIRELTWWQGFSPKQGIKEMTRVDGRFLCGRHWYITWKIDDKGHVSEIIGDVSDTCL